MSGFFDRFNIVKRRREAALARDEQLAQELQTFDDRLRGRLNETLRLEDPVARYIAFDELTHEFARDATEIYEGHRKEWRAWALKNVSRVTKGSGAVGLGVAATIGIAAGPLAIVPGLIFGGAVFYVGAIGSYDLVEKGEKGATQESQPLFDRVRQYNTVIRDIAARLEDEHLERFAASPEWERVSAINPRLEKKMGEAFRTAAANRAKPAPPPAPSAPGKPGFRL